MDEGDGVVGEQWVGASGEVEVVSEVAGGGFEVHAGQAVAERDPLVQRGAMSTST